MTSQEMREFRNTYRELVSDLVKFNCELTEAELAERNCGFLVNYGDRLGSLRIGISKAIDQMMLYMAGT